MFNFEKLEVWQKAIVVADVIYSHTRNFLSEQNFRTIYGSAEKLGEC